MAKCGETAGFLIAAPCKNQSMGKCHRCKKPICDKHTRRYSAESQIMCITCYRKSGARYTEDDDDPYLYGGYYYSDYYERSHYREEWGGSEAFAGDNNFDDGDWEGDFDGS